MRSVRLWARVTGVGNKGVVVGVDHRIEDGEEVIVGVVGVEQAIIVALVISMIDHLGRGYRPNDAMLVRSAGGHLKSVFVEPGFELLPGWSPTGSLRGRTTPTRHASTERSSS